MVWRHLQNLKLKVSLETFRPEVLVNELVYRGVFGCRNSKQYNMLSEKVEKVLNEQIQLEGYSSQLYLAMASWAEKSGYEGTANFLYDHSDEERQHMLRLFHYVNDRGGHAVAGAIDSPSQTYESVQDVFEQILEHEVFISQKINELVGTCLDERDFTTQAFLQWYVNEQIEEESVFRSILDKIMLLGDDKARMYMFDRDIASMAASKVPLTTPAQ